MRTFSFLLSFLLLTSATSFAGPGTLLRIDSSGKPGEDANDIRQPRDYKGQKARDGADANFNFGDFLGNGGDGEHGRSGGNSVNPRAGEGSGNINLKLKAQNPKNTKGLVFDGSVIVDAKFNRGARGRYQTIKNKISIIVDSFIHLKARGGRGGAGGIGGTPEAGGGGGRGRNAQKPNTRAGNGGRGGNAGDVGLGTHGADGGHGGQVVIEVNEMDTHLLTLVEEYVDIAGAPGGSPGRNGQVRQGGSAGMGGSGTSWTEDTGRNKPDGTPIRESKSLPQGLSGRRGEESRRPRNSSYRSGRTGESGEFVIEVKDKSGDTKRYKKRFDVASTGFELVTENNNGFLEPGEKVVVRNITLTNSGGMPLPKGRDVVIYLSNTDWTVSNGVQLTLPRDLPAGESVTLNDEITLTVKNTTLRHVGDSPFKANDTIRPTGAMGGTKYIFGDVNSSQNISIKYPIQITDIDTLSSLEPGTATKVFWHVKNISKQELGENSDLKRIIETHLKLKGENIDAKDIVLLDSNLKPIDTKGGLVEAIAKLGPGEDMVVEGVIGVKSTGATQGSINSTIDLNLGDINEPGATKKIQAKLATIRVSEVYKKTKGSDYLVVTNGDVKKESIDAIRASAKRLGSTVDLYDMSYYGFLNLTEAMNNGSSVMEDFKGKTIVFLNNEFEFPATEDTVRNLSLLQKQNFLEAASNHGINVVVYGQGESGRSGIVDQLMVPTGKEDTKLSYTSLKEYLKTVSPADLENKKAKIAKDAPSQVLEDGINTLHEIELFSTRMFFGKKRQPILFAEKAKNLSYVLESLTPDKQYNVVYEYEPKIIKKYLGGMFKKRSLGKFKIRQGVESALGNVAAFDVGVNSSHFSSDAGAFSLLLGKSFDEKLEDLSKVLDFKNTEINEKEIPLLRDALLFDLANEQALIRYFDERAQKLSRSQTSALLIKLKKVLGKLGYVANSKEAANLVIDLVANMQYMADVNSPWYNYLFRRNQSLRVSGQTSKMIETFIEATFNKEKGDAKNFKQSVDAKVAELKAKWSDTARSGRGEKVVRSYTEVDNAVAYNAENRVLEAKEYQQMTNRDAKNAEWQDNFSEEQKEAKKKYLVDIKDCKDLF